VGDEAFREDVPGRVLFRKGDAIGYVSGKSLGCGSSLTIAIPLT
jgi:hypothetical protein